MMLLETKKGTITIRSAAVTDAEAYRELRIEGLRAAPTAFGKAAETAEQLSLDDWRERLRVSDAMFHMVAEAGSDLVGMTLFRRDQGVKVEHQGYINSVYLRPAWRGLGVIDGLVAMGMEWAQRKGLRIIKLSVTSTNTAAIRTYSRLGFQVYGIEPDVLLWEGVYYNELLMYKRLEAGTVAQ